MTARRWLLWLGGSLVALSVVLAAPAATAQPKGDKRDKVEARLQKLKQRVLKREVGLDDAKADEVEKILRKHEPERRKLQKEQRTHREAARDLLREDSDDQDAYKKAITGFRAAQKKLGALREREMDELSKILTPKQQAKLYAALVKLRRRMARHGRAEE